MISRRGFLGGVLGVIGGTMLPAIPWNKTKPPSLGLVQPKPEGGVMRYDYLTDMDAWFIKGNYPDEEFIWAR